MTHATGKGRGRFDRQCSNPRGVIVYDGPSLLNGDRIVAVLTARSNNQKTGDMGQLWILAANHDPITAARSGRDASVCGRCPLRGDGVHRGCYVDLARGPSSVWKAWRRGLYPDAWANMPGANGRPLETEQPGAICSTASVLPRSPVLHRATRGRMVRLGAYGDPAALPRAVLDAVVRDAAGWTGYSAQWRDGFALADLVMASVQSHDDREQAAAMGWRTFHVTATAEPRAAGAMVCPASAEAGHRLTCDTCGACSGTGRGKATAHVQIAAHGSPVSTLRYALKVLQNSARSEVRA